MLPYGTATKGLDQQSGKHQKWSITYGFLHLVIHSGHLPYIVSIDSVLN